MTEAVENGLLGGVTDTTIAPQGKLTRAQMATIINRAFGATAQASLSGYTDVASNAWYYSDMAKAVQMGTSLGWAVAASIRMQRSLVRKRFACSPVPLASIPPALQA